MLRATFIERIRRIIYGGQPSDDAAITKGMVNNILSDAIAVAAKANWTDNIKMEGCAFINGAFYTTFKGIAITNDDEFSVYNIPLPHIPVALGQNDGIQAVYVIDGDGVQSKPIIMLTVSQVSYYEDLPQMNGLFGWNEGGVVKVKCSDASLSGFTAKVRMVSGGDTALTSELNVPSDYYPIMQEYILKTLGIEQEPKAEQINDGVDSKN